ncbi:ACP S-malonyltransferase [Psychrobacter sp. HD31]|uniref:ACP S-malonyltransferase n=1 Tax=Psychrobacter sp. HD31 TaxID=3112003 RepID=UPI003DA23BAA
MDSTKVGLDDKPNKRIAIVFPGQGSQNVGMLTELSEEYPIITQTFTEASNALGFDLWEVCQDEQQLNQTEYTQPALLTASVALWRVLKDQVEQPVFMAGHSLGEFSALCASGAISLADAVVLVHKRGKLMQEAVANQETMMAAVLGLEDEQVLSLCEQIRELDEAASVNPANFNSPGQVVIAGNKTGVEQVVEQVKNNLGKKAIPLKVSVPSHCELMQPASEALQAELNRVKINEPLIPVIQNRHARVEKTMPNIKQALVEQLSNPVQWAKTIEELAAKQVELLIEVGSGNVLTNLTKRQKNVIPAYPTDRPERLQKLFEELS